VDGLQDFLCFKLGSAARSMQKYYNSRCAEFGITIAQSFILFSLLANDGLNPKTMAEQLEIDGSAITGLLDRLEKEGLVERRQDPADRRAFCVFLTKKGRRKAEDVLPAAMEVNKRLKASLGKGEEQAVSRFLDRVKDLDE
jgi:DNA-binding MarR family transcriptional regulator